MGVAQMIFSLLSLCLFLLFPSPAAAISPISVKGRKLYDQDGNQFFVRGVVYVAGQSRLDPLADAKQCAADAVLMRNLGVNTIYVYSIDPERDHDGCMEEFAKQGIYLWLNLGDFPRSTDSLQQEPQWTASEYAWWTQCMDSVAAFDNVLAFGIAQQTIGETANSTVVAPSLKAAARDVRAYRDARGYRAIPLSYSAGEEEQFQLLTAQYLTCGDTDETIDIFGLNIFEGCEEADYDQLRDRYRDFHIPLIISESGCADRSGRRDFEEVALTFSSRFQEVFSGASVYEWSEKNDGMGLVQYPNDANLGFPTTLSHFNTLSSIYASRPAGTPAVSYTPSNSAPSCPTADPSLGWLVDGTAPLPTIAGLQVSTVSRITTTSDPVGGPTGAPDTAGEQGDDGTFSAGASDGGGTNGLSTGAIAGIAIGCALGALGTVLGFFLFLRERKRARQSGNYPEDKPKFELPAEAKATEMAGTPQSQMSPEHAWKFPGQEVGELPEQSDVRELPGGNSPMAPTSQHHYELEGSPVEGLTQHGGE
ncbi:1,3-beta-glucanosyltransferase [Madurella fahalii]|uniref:1,3-beta-glucanosyltransferase n=1 Tax=Madurella fahalii TaxID=1157608 RepID=A0ABQ0GK95_9PEZI